MGHISIFCSFHSNFSKLKYLLLHFLTLCLAPFLQRIALVLQQGSDRRILVLVQFCAKTTGSWASSTTNNSSLNLVPHLCISPLLCVFTTILGDRYCNAEELIKNKHPYLQYHSQKATRTGNSLQNKPAMMGLGWSSGCEDSAQCQVKTVQEDKNLNKTP